MKVTYVLHGVAFSVDADKSLAEKISRAVMPTCAVAAGSGRGPAFTVRSENGQHAVHRGQKFLWSAASESELIPWLEAEVVNWLLRRFRRYVQVHAAVVQRRGRAALVVGGADAGKTSLACALALGGWGVMSDEVALVEPRDAMVACFPRAMLVRSGTARRLRELQRCRPRRVVLNDGPESIRYVSPDFAGGVVRQKARVVAVAFPEWSGRSSVEVIGEREALERMLQACFNTDRHPVVSIDTCVGLVRTSRLLRARVGKLREAAELLSEAIGAGR